MRQAHAVPITDRAMEPRLTPGFANLVVCDPRVPAVNGSIVVISNGISSRIRVLRAKCPADIRFAPLARGGAFRPSTGWAVVGVVVRYIQFPNTEDKDYMLLEHCDKGLPITRPVEA